MEDVVWTESGETRLSMITAVAERLGYVVRRLDGALMTDKASLLGQFAAALKFPGYFGNNLDAFTECLADLEENFPAAGYLVIVASSERIFSADRALFGDVLECARYAAKTIRADSRSGARLKLIFVTDDLQTANAVGPRL